MRLKVLITNNYEEKSECNLSYNYEINRNYDIKL